MEKMSRIESRTGGIGSVDYNHYSAPRAEGLDRAQSEQVAVLQPEWVAHMARNTHHPVQPPNASSTLPHVAVAKAAGAQPETE